MNFTIMDPEVVKQRFEQQTGSPQTLAAATALDATPHPALDGKRVTDIDNPIGIYFVWNGGRKSVIPTEDAYNALFADWNGILGLKSYDLAKIADGEAISWDSAIVKGEGEDAQYLLTTGHKYGIVSLSVKDYCNFGGYIEVRPARILHFVPDGPFNIDYGA